MLAGHRGGAFTSYVRRRGEPDGRTACAADMVKMAAKVGRVVGRPGGGGESDAAFTPSPPVAMQVSERGRTAFC